MTKKEKKFKSSHLNSEQKLVELTSLQSDLFLEQLLRPKSSHLNIGGFIRLRDIEPSKLIQAHEELVSSEESFRTTLITDEFGTFFDVNKKVDICLPFIDVSHYQNPDAMAREKLNNMMSEPFALTDTLLYRVMLIKKSEREYWYIGVGHHLIFDGWSFVNWSRSLALLYSNKATAISKFSYEVVSDEYLSYKRSNKLKKDLAYWTERLVDTTKSPLKPFYNQELESSVAQSIRHSVPITKECLSDLDTVAYDLGATRPQVIMACIAYYFLTVYGEKHLTFGLPIHGRRKKSQRGHIGLYLSILPTKISIKEGGNFASVLYSLMKAQKSDLRHLQISCGQILSGLNTSSNVQRLYDVAFSYLVREDTISFDHTEAQLEFAHTTQQITPVLITFFESSDDDNEALMQVDVSTGYFSPAEGDLLSKRLCSLISSLKYSLSTGKSPGLLCEDDLRMISKHAQTDYLSKVGHLDRVEELIDTQFKERPEATAIKIGKKSWTYRELSRDVNNKAEKLAFILNGECGRVGLAMPRSYEMLVTMLSILKCGCAYVPLDPSYPEKRLKDYLYTTKCRIVLTAEGTPKINWPNDVFVVNLDCVHSPIELVEFGSKAKLQSAYVIFTSGTTGKPKAIDINHRNVIHLIDWAQGYFSESELSNVYACTSINFDLSIFELFVPLCLGSTCVISQGKITDHKIPDGVTLINTVPSAAQILLEQRYFSTSVKVVNVAGEVLDKKLLNSLLLETNCERVNNLYGPSEDTTYSTVASFNEVQDERPNIGKSLKGKGAFILDKNCDWLPMNVIGEIWLNGEGLAAGYVNDEVETNARFKYIRLPDGSEVRCYRTGDLGRFLDDGSIQYFGRLDDQVKVRGFRIELSEIEASINQKKYIRRSVVKPVGDAANSTLTAYLEFEDEIKQDQSLITKAVKALHAGLTDHLPSYMLPAVYVKVCSFPMNNNGKIDKSALFPDIGEKINYLRTDSDEVELSAQEELIAKIWLNHLDTSTLHRDDNFFAIGGQSLSAIRVALEIEKVFNVRMTITDFYSNPTIGDLSEYISRSQKQSNFGIAEAIIDNVPSTFGQQGLWFLDKVAGSTPEYNVASGFMIKGDLNISRLKNALVMLGERHPILLSRYIINGHQLKTVIDFNRKIELNIDEDPLDISSLDRNEVISLYVQDIAQNSFDLEEGGLFKAYLKMVDHNNYILVLSAHHIIVDGWSLEILFKDLDNFYSTPQDEKIVRDYSYLDYSLSQREWSKNGAMQAGLSYWLKKLDKLPSIHKLKLKNERNPSWDSSGKLISQTLSRISTEYLNETSRKLNVSRFCVFYGALSLYLSRASNADIVPIGVPMANRSHGEFSETVGMFVNPVVLATSTGTVNNFEEFVAIADRDVKDALSFQDIPFELIVSNLNIEKEKGASPLFQIWLNWLDFDPFIPQLTDCDLIPINKRSDVKAKYDLAVDIRNQNEKTSIEWLYADYLFDDDYIDELASGFDLFIRQLSTLDLQSTFKESEQIAPPFKNTLMDALRSVIELNPESIALCGNDREITYATLDHESNRVAANLYNKSESKRLAILSNQSDQLIITLLGILKSNYAYVPLHNQYPEVKISSIQEQTGFDLLIYSENKRDMAASISESLGIDSLCISDLFKGDDHVFYRDQAHSPVNDEACILFTSGSSGESVGVVQTRSGIEHYAQEYGKKIGISKGEKIALLSNIAFDAAAMDIWACFLNGATLVTYDLLASPRGDIYKSFVTRAVDYIHGTPTVLSYLLEPQISKGDAWQPKTVIFGGETVSESLYLSLKTSYPETNVIVSYGCTEVSFVAFNEIETKSDLKYIGNTIADISIDILTEDNVVAGINEEGYIAVKSNSITCRLLSNELKRAGTIVKVLGLDYIVPGDFGIKNNEGKIKFLGRKDQQIKFNGIRINLLEIEEAIKTYIEDIQCLVSYQESFIVAFIDYSSVSSKIDKELTVESLSESIFLFLKERLPGYMLPKITFLDKFQKTPSGKIDRQAIKSSVGGNPLAVTSNVDNVSGLHKNVLLIWQSILSTEVDDFDLDFFELGGHSMLLLQLLDKIESEFSVKLPLSVLFEGVSINQCVELIRVAVAMKSERLEIFRSVDTNDYVF